MSLYITDEQRARKRAWSKEYYLRNRDLILEKRRVARLSDPSKARARDRYYRIRNRDRHAENERRRLYQLGPEAFAALFRSQDGRCAICQQERKLHVDHHHQTGVVRALLCNNCNTLLGFADEDAGRLRAAAAYLERPRPAPPQLVLLEETA